MEITYMGKTATINVRVDESDKKSAEQDVEAIYQYIVCRITNQIRVALTFSYF